MAFKVTLQEKQAGFFVASLVGSLDSDTYENLEKVVSSALLPSTKVLIFNMADLTYVCSMGLNTIFKIRKSVEANNGVFVMTNLQPQIRKVFEVVNALQGMNVFTSIEEADRYLNKIQRGEIK